MKSPKNIGEALENLFGINQITPRMLAFKPDASVKGEPFYTLMQHENGFLNSKYFTIPGPRDRSAIVFFENYDKAERFLKTRPENSPPRTDYYLRGLTRDHLATMVRFFELGDVYAAFVDEDNINDPRVPLKLRFVEPRQLWEMSQSNGPSLLSIFKRIFRN